MDEEILSYNTWIARNRYMDYLRKRYYRSSGIISMRTTKYDSDREMLKAQLEFLRSVKSEPLRRENVKVDRIVTKTPIARGCHRDLLSDQPS